MTVHEALIADLPTVTFDLHQDIHKGIRAELFTVTATAEVVSTPDLDLLALEFEAHGLAGRDLAVGAVVLAARTAGLSPVLVDVLGDTAEPEIARLRAFGHLASLLSAACAAPASPPPATSPSADPSQPPVGVVGT